MRQKNSICFLPTVDNLILILWRHLKATEANFFFWYFRNFFFRFFDDFTQNFMLIPNLSLFQWLLLYLKRYRPLKFGQNGFRSISFEKLDQFSVCRFGYISLRRIFLYIIAHILITENEILNYLDVIWRHCLNLGVSVVKIKR